jgi:hypothetical protein
MSVVPGPVSQDAVFKLLYASPALPCRWSSVGCLTLFRVDLGGAHGQLTHELVEFCLVAQCCLSLSVICVACSALCYDSPPHKLARKEPSCSVPHLECGGIMFQLVFVGSNRSVLGWQNSLITFEVALNKSKHFWVILLQCPNGGGGGGGVTNDQGTRVHLKGWGGGGTIACKVFP